MPNTRHVCTDSLTLRVCCSVHCYLLAAEVTEEVGGGDGGSASDNDGDAHGDNDSDSDNAMDEEGVGTSCESATKGKQKIEDKVMVLRECLSQDLCRVQP